MNLFLKDNTKPFCNIINNPIKWVSCDLLYYLNVHFFILKRTAQRDRTLAKCTFRREAGRFLKGVKEFHRSYLKSWIIQWACDICGFGTCGFKCPRALNLQRSVPPGCSKPNHYFQFSAGIWMAIITPQKSLPVFAWKLKVAGVWSGQPFWGPQRLQMVAHSLSGPQRSLRRWGELSSPYRHRL